MELLAFLVQHDAPLEMNCAASFISQEFIHSRICFPVTQLFEWMPLLQHQETLLSQHCCILLGCIKQV